MSSPRPGRRAAPKTSKWSRVKVTRGGGSTQPTGRRAAEPRGRRVAMPPEPVPPELVPPELVPAEPVPAEVETAPAPPPPAPELETPDLPALPIPQPPTEVAADASLEVHRPERPTSAPARGSSWQLLLGMGVLLALGIAALAAAALHTGPGWLDGAGAIAILTTYTWALLARTGGRQVVFTVLALVLGVVTVIQDGEVLRSGAAVMTCVVSGVLAVVITTPARGFLAVVREVVVATAVASVGAFATVGFEPVASSVRFEYITLAMGFAVIFALVWRFGAGLHGLGTRGLITVLVGTLLLAGSLTYAELLRRYGVEGVVEPSNAAVDWSRDNLGAFPSPIMVFLGVPALAWGVHMRARRRQGWWVCAFGAASTLVVAQSLVNRDISYVEAGLQQTYGVALGLGVGYLVIRLDQRLTGQRGRRARAAEAEHAMRPEPRRFSSL